MLMLVLEPEVDALLCQTAADLEVSPEEMASLILSSCLLMSLVR